MRVRALLTATLLLGGAAACSGRAPEPGARATDGRPWNVLLISLDTMRADRLSFYGELDRETTPLLDRLASESLVFTDCLATSTVTGPSHLSLFTGQWVQRHGLRENGGRAEPAYTLASELARHGYETGGFTGGGYLRESFGLDVGFETYRARGGPMARFKRTFETSMPHALQWLRERGERPWFLFLHGFDPHCPYEVDDVALRPFARVAPRPFDATGKCGERDYLPLLEQGAFDDDDRTHLEDLYDALVHEADQSLKPLVQYLRKQDLLDRTLLVFTSDHGEGLGEHDFIGHGRLWDEHARVPLFVRFPGGEPRGVIDAPTSLVDVLPTVLDALDLPVPDGVQGRSLLSLAREPEPDPRRLRVVSFAERDAVRFGPRWKLVLEREADGLVPVSLFDLEADPGELVDLAPDPALRATIDDLRGRTARWIAENAAEDARHASAVGAPDLDADERSELDALGYAGED